MVKMRVVEEARTSAIARNQKHVEKVDAERRQAALLEYAKIQCELFPNVPNITSEELLELVEERAVGDWLILVDCRSDVERQASVLSGAVTKEKFAAHVDEYSDKAIVTYCAIGRRSGLFAQQLLASHPDMKVRNHAGSVVDWTHLGGPMVEETTGRSTKKVHSNGIWTSYLPLAKDLQVIT